MVTKQLVFGPFRLDPDNAALWSGTQAIPLTPKAFATLQYLLEHPGRLVTKGVLLDAVWPDTAVSDAVLKVRIGEIRKALGDSAKAPRFIVTVHQRGYQFIAPVTSAEWPQAPSEVGPRLPTALEASTSRLWPLAPRAPHVVGREAVFAHLQEWLAQAWHGARHVVFVTGEPGIGKTAVMEAFAARVAADAGLMIAWGQCIAHYGAGEAYLPVLEALGRLCREPGHAHVIVRLRQVAPMWLVQMPWLLSATDREALQRELLGATRERMLREMAELLEDLTAQTPLLLVLEDLHWSDTATLDLLAYLARRQEPARLLLLGTYRPVEGSVSRHPLKGLTHELQLHGQCAEVPVELLSEAEVAAYMAARLAGGVLEAELPRALYQCTEGLPLFMVSLVDHLVTHGVLVEHEGRWSLKGGVEAVERSVPESIRQMIEQQFEQLALEEQRVLAAASVAGVAFSAAAVAAALAEDLVAVEERCEALARRQHFLRPTGMAEWPDGTVASRYAFLHALHHHVVYQRLAAAQRVALHRRIGAQVEASYGGRAGEIAAELAVHFEQGRDIPRAVRYLWQAAEKAVQRYANREALHHLTKGLAYLQTLPDTPERAWQELRLQMTLGSVLLALQGSGAPDVARTYARAQELCQRVGETPQLFPVLSGLWISATARAEHTTARTLGEQYLRLAQRTQDPAHLLGALHALGTTLLFRGEFGAARTHLEQGQALYDPQRYHPLTLLYGRDLGVMCLAREAWVLWFLGYPDQALVRSQAALTLAQELSHPNSLVFALDFAAAVRQFRREGQAVHQLTQAALHLSSAQGFAQLGAMAMVLQGWAHSASGQGADGTDQLRQGLAAWEATGSALAQPHYLALLAEAYGAGEQVEQGLHALAEALAAVRTTGEEYYAAELYRLQGELLLRQASPDERRGETALQQAFEMARRQQAKSWELRTATSLCRLWQQQGKRAEAYELLVPTYGWFTEGFETADLQDARALLDELET